MMKLKIPVLLFVIFMFCDLHAQEDYKITWDIKGLTFNEFAARAEAAYNLKFYFKDEWVADLKPDNYKGNGMLSDFLSGLFREKSLYYFIDDEGRVIITKNFAVKAGLQGTSQSGGQTFLPPTEYYDPNDANQSSGNVVYDVGNPADKNKPGNVSITGYITDRESKEPVAGVTVFNNKLAAGSISNQYGYYNISLPRGTHQLEFSFIGMKEKNITVNLYGAGEVNIEMNSTLIPLKETIVSAQKNMVLQRYEVGVEKINLTSFRLMPTSLGDADIIKSVLMIPGVQSVGEGSAGFNVRGGSSDQNLILLYGAPVYNASHLFGFFTAVNADIIKDVTLYKGGIPARYGGRISSVLDIGTSEGNKKKFGGTAGISPITTHLMVEGPVIKDTLSYILTGRTTYSNWVFDLLDDPSLSNSSASFYDFNAKVTYDPNKNNKIEFSAYISHDSFRFNSDSLYSYDNNIFALKWRHFFNSRFFSVFSVNNSGYRYDINSHSNPIEGFVLSHKMNSTAFKADFNWYQGRNEVNYGVDLTRYSVLPGSYLPYNSESLVIPSNIQHEQAFDAAVYIEDKFKVNDYLSVNGGFRFSSFFAVGPQDILIYDPDFSKTRSSVTDTISYNSNQLSKAYAGPEFRVSLNFRINNKSSFKINYNKTRQYIHMLSNSTSIAPTDTWKLSDYYIKPQVGDQYAMGFYQMLLNNSIETSVEVYYKDIRNMVDFKGGTNLVMNADVEKDLINVTGRAYGIEFLLKKLEGKVRWSLGYTYSRSELKSNGTFSDEIINGGKWFPTNYDKPHDLFVTLNYLFSRRFSFSTNYIYSTGRPITYPVSTYYLDDLLLINYSERNKYRVPYYARLDVSVKVSGNLKSRKIAHPNWTFSVYNLLGRQNVYSVYFKNENSNINGYQLSVFGQAIPTVTFSFDF
jgi:hypothetical protein